MISSNLELSFPRLYRTEPGFWCSSSLHELIFPERMTINPNLHTHIALVIGALRGISVSAQSTADFNRLLPAVFRCQDGVKERSGLRNDPVSEDVC
jgi:hypothetical protein